MEEKEVNSGPSSQKGPKTPGNALIMGVLCYLGILVVVPILTSKSDPFVKFHIKQGLVLAVGEVIIWFLGMFSFGAMSSLWLPLSSLLSLGFLILSIVGIVNVTKKEEKLLPYLGILGSKFDPYL